MGRSSPYVFMDAICSRHTAYHADNNDDVTGANPDPSKSKNLVRFNIHGDNEDVGASGSRHTSYSQVFNPDTSVEYINKALGKLFPVQSDNPDTDQVCALPRRHAA
jgi:hypothetical protein